MIILCYCYVAWLLACASEVSCALLSVLKHLNTSQPFLRTFEWSKLRDSTLSTGEHKKHNRNTMFRNSHRFYLMEFLKRWLPWQLSVHLVCNDEMIALFLLHAVCNYCIITSTSLSIPSVLNESIYLSERIGPASLPHSKLHQFLMEMRAHPDPILRLFSMYADGVYEGFQSSWSLLSPADHPEDASPIIWEISWCLPNDASISNEQLPSKMSAIWRKHQTWWNHGEAMA